MNSAPTNDDRMLASIRAIIRAEFPQLSYMGIWEYAIQAVHGTGASATIDADPTSSITLPSIAGCPLLPIVGATCTPVVGSLAFIVFANGDPTKYRCVSLDAAPDEVLLAGGANPVALSNLVATQLANLATALTTHVHAGVTAGAAVTGVAAPVYTPGTVAATKVKAT